MVGLPFPNSQSLELQEKMKYLERSTGDPSAGQTHYQNLCMKAVNQSIGRAIRHRNDHACILLVDARYARPGIESRLPQWIRTELRRPARFGEAVANIRDFFKSKAVK